MSKKTFWAVVAATPVLAVIAVCTAISIKPPLPKKTATTQVAEPERPRERDINIQVRALRLPAKSLAKWQTLYKETQCPDGVRCLTLAEVPFGIQFNEKNEIVAFTWPGSRPFLRLIDPYSLKVGRGMTRIVWWYGSEGILLRLEKDNSISYARWQYVQGH